MCLSGQPILLDTQSSIFHRVMLEYLDCLGHRSKLVPPSRAWDLDAGVARRELSHGERKGDDRPDDLPADGEKAQRADQNGNQNQEALVQEVTSCVGRHSLRTCLCQIDRGIGHANQALQRGVRLLYPAAACNLRLIAGDQQPIDIVSVSIVTIEKGLFGRCGRVRKSLRRFWVIDEFQQRCPCGPHTSAELYCLSLPIV